MAAIADTSILIDHLRGRREAVALVEQELDAQEPIFASVLTKTEVLAGARPGEEDGIDALFGVFVWIEVTEAIAERAGMLANRFVRSHPGIELADYVIAASRDELGVALWTRNVRHFPMVEGLCAPYGSA